MSVQWSLQIKRKIGRRKNLDNTLETEKNQSEDKQKSWFQNLCDEFSSSIRDLNRQEKILLRRSMGLTFTESSPQAHIVFYSHIPETVKKDEYDIWFFCLCIYAYQDTLRDKDKHLENALSEFYNNEYTSESQKAKVRALLSYRICDDGRIIHYLAKMIKMLEKDGNMSINVPSLLSNLLRWNNGAADEWARKIAYFYKEEKKDE